MTIETEPTPAQKKRRKRSNPVADAIAEVEMGPDPSPPVARPKRRKKADSVDFGGGDGTGQPADPEKTAGKRSRYSLSTVSGAGIFLADISTLKPWPNNARLHSESQVELIAKSIRDGGFNDPVEVDEHRVILAGHGRVMAAKLIGLKEVPCIQHTHLTQAQKRRYVLRANQSALNATWDEELLVQELRDMLDDDLAVRDLGFDDDMLKKALAETLELPPDLETDDGTDTTALSTEEGTAPPEDYEVANQEHRELTGEDLAPVPDAEKPRYHQLPPEDATRAIRASEERIPVAWLMNREEHDKLEEYKVLVGARTDRQALRHALGWEPIIITTEGNNAKVTNTKLEGIPDGDSDGAGAVEGAGGGDPQGGG